MSKPVPIRTPENPQGRLDILLVRVAEACVRWGEAKLQNRFGIAANFWDGPEGVKSVIEAKIEEVGIPRERLSPRVLAEQAGFLKSRPKLRGRRSA